MVRSAGIAEGSRVLDVGSGSGSFIQSLAQAIGEGGQLIALDPASEHLALIERRALQWKLPCSISTQLGSILSLPFADNSFDALWCASVTQYLSEVDLLAALGECVRVVRPGGLVAMKDVDMTLMRVHPGDPLLVAKLSDAARAADSTPHSAGSLRGRELRLWLVRAGLEDVWQQTILIERWAPLDPATSSFYKQWLAFLARRAHEVGMAEKDLAQWRAFEDPAAPTHPADRTDFYLCEGQVLAVGRVPHQ